MGANASSWFSVFLVRRVFCTRSARREPAFYLPPGLHRSATRSKGERNSVRRVGAQQRLVLVAPSRGSCASARLPYPSEVAPTFVGDGPKASTPVSYDGAGQALVEFLRRVGAHWRLVLVAHDRPGRATLWAAPLPRLSPETTPKGLRRAHCGAP
jgi:hypothetical protein